MPETPEEKAARIEKERLAKIEEDRIEKERLANLSNEEKIAEQIKLGVAEGLASIKTKLNSAFTERDEAKAQLAAQKKLEEDQRIERLRSDGKEVEALQAELAAAKAETDSLKSSNTKLSRDNTVSAEFLGIEFRSPKARKVAIDEIKDSLTQNDKGEWVTAAGHSISSAVSSFLSDEGNAFLLKPKNNSGKGSKDQKKTPPSKDKSDSLFAKSQEEVMEMVRQGKLK
jgi:hypothetical protein